MNIGPVPSPKEDDQCGKLPNIQINIFEKQTKIKTTHFHEISERNVYMHYFDQYHYILLDSKQCIHKNT